MKATSRKKLKRGLVKNQTPLSRTARSPSKQERTAENWNASNEVKKAVFHGLRTTKHVCSLAYHGAIALCKVIVRAAADHLGRIIFLSACVWSGLHSSCPVISHIAHFIAFAPFTGAFK